MNQVVQFIDRDPSGEFRAVLQVSVDANFVHIRFFHLCEYFGFAPVSRWASLTAVVQMTSYLACKHTIVFRFVIPLIYHTLTLEITVVVMCVPEKPISVAE